MSAYNPQTALAMGILVAAVLILLYEIWLFLLRPPIDIHAVAFQQLLDLFIKMVDENGPPEHFPEDALRHAESALYALRRSRAKIQSERKVAFYKALVQLLTKIEHRYGSGRRDARRCLHMINSVRKLTTPILNRASQ